MAYEDLMVTKIGYQQLDNTLACSRLQDSGESKSNGDSGAVSRVRRKGGTKVFKYGQKSPWVPTLTELFPKIQADPGS